MRSSVCVSRRNRSSSVQRVVFALVLEVLDILRSGIGITQLADCGAFLCDYLTHIHLQKKGVEKLVFSDRFHFSLTIGVDR